MTACNTRLLAAVLLVASTTLFSNAQASSCKSLDQQACSAEATCKWIGSYQRSDGRTVKAYCRSAPAKRGALDIGGDKVVSGDN